MAQDLSKVAGARRVSNYKGKAGDEQKKADPQHLPKPSMFALGETKMVEGGIKYWEEKTEFDRPSSDDWSKLRCAKDFETGMGANFFKGGTLSRWTDAEIATLQSEIQKTLSMAANSAQIGGGLAKIDLDPSAFAIPNLTPAVVTPTPNYNELDAAISGAAIATDKKKKKKPKNSGGVSFAPDVVVNSALNESVPGTAELEAEAKEMSKNRHRRTRTEALRVKLDTVQQQLSIVETELETTHVEQARTEADMLLLESSAARDRRQLSNKAKLSKKVAAITAALHSAQGELEGAEKQISDRDQEILNLRRELHISKQMNEQLSGAKSKVSGEPMGSPVVSAEMSGGLSAEDLLKQRIKDAQKFAFMLSAMQEQLEFERKQFSKQIHLLENQLEHKDIQINALYQVYNQLIDKTQQKGWFARVRESVVGTASTLTVGGSPKPPSNPPPAKPN